MSAATPPVGKQAAVWGVVLAAGTGTRFGSWKQFVKVGGHRLVDLAVRETVRACGRVVVVVPPGIDWDGAAVAEVVEGGASRAQSVRRALSVIPDTTEFVLLHSASHPLAPAWAFDAVLAAVQRGAAGAVPGLRPTDVVRRVRNGIIVEALGRDDLVLVQSPVAFRADVLRAAYAASGEATEDTELVTAIGETVTVVPGDPRNLHVTTPSDLELAARLVLTSEGASVPLEGDAEG